LQLDIQQRVEEARPVNVADDHVVDRLARGLAHSIAETSTARGTRRRPRMQLMTALTLGFVAIGGTAAAAVPALISWAPWEPDIVVERSFPLTGSDAVQDCVTVIRVMPDAATAGINAGDRLRAARAFLRDNDWTHISANLADIPAKEREGMERQGISESMMLTMQVNDQITAAFADEGHLGDGVRLELSARCGDAGDR
jgi:hypothetical protein